MSVLGQGSDTQPSLMIDPSEGQTAVVASAESLKQTCHRFYLRFHTFIHIDRIDVLNFVNVLQQILQDSKKVTGKYRRVPLVWKEDCEERVFWWLSKERISRLWNPSPTALSAHLGTGARHFWDLRALRAFRYIFSCLDIHFPTFSTHPSMFALFWLNDELVNSSFVNWKVQRKPKTGAASRRHSSASGAWLCQVREILDIRLLDRCEKDVSAW